MWAVHFLVDPGVGAVTKRIQALSVGAQSTTAKPTYQILAERDQTRDRSERNWDSPTKAAAKRGTIAPPTRVETPLDSVTLFSSCLRADALQRGKAPSRTWRRTFPGWEDALGVAGATAHVGRPTVGNANLKLAIPELLKNSQCLQRLSVHSSLSLSLSSVFYLSVSTCYGWKRYDDADRMKQHPSKGAASEGWYNHTCSGSLYFRLSGGACSSCLQLLFRLVGMPSCCRGWGAGLEVLKVFMFRGWANELNLEGCAKYVNTLSSRCICVCHLYNQSWREG